MRLFLGINPSQEVKLSIHDYLLPIQKSPKGWENPHDYHQTLLFIGDVSDELVPEIISRMGQILFAQFVLKTSEVKFFNRRIMYLAFEPSLELIELKNLIDKTFPELVSKETKAFLPHMTIKRWQRYEYDHLDSSLKERPAPKWEIVVKGLSLFKSEKNHLNQKYHEINFVNFKD